MLNHKIHGNNILNDFRIDFECIITFTLEKEHICMLCRCRNITEEKIGLNFLKVISTTTKTTNPDTFVFDKISKFIIAYQFHKIRSKKSNLARKPVNYSHLKRQGR